jgi:hypothetical protein
MLGVLCSGFVGGGAHGLKLFTGNVGSILRKSGSFRAYCGRLAFGKREGRGFRVGAGGESAGNMRNKLRSNLSILDPLLYTCSSSLGSLIFRASRQ